MQEAEDATEKQAVLAAERKTPSGELEPRNQEDSGVKHVRELTHQLHTRHS